MRGGRELIVTYIFGHMLPQKCNLHFLIYLDKCNLHFWGTIQEKTFWNLKIVSYICEATSEIVTYIFEVCGCVALTLMPNNSQPIASIIQHAAYLKKKIICPIYTISWVVTYFCRKIPKLWWNLMMCHLAFFLIKSLGRGSHSDQR